MRRSAAILALGAALCIAASVAAQTNDAYETAHEALTNAYDEDAPVRNFTYLYLRLAGLIWIATEWVAAIVLVRLYFFLPRYLVAAEERQ